MYTKKEQITFDYRWRDDLFLNRESGRASWRRRERWGGLEDIEDLDMRILGRKKMMF